MAANNIVDQGGRRETDITAESDYTLRIKDLDFDELLNNFNTDDLPIPTLVFERGQAFAKSAHHDQVEFLQLMGISTTNVILGGIRRIEGDYTYLMTREIFEVNVIARWKELVATSLHYNYLAKLAIEQANSPENEVDIISNLNDMTTTIDFSANGVYGQKAVVVYDLSGRIINVEDLMSKIDKQDLINSLAGVYAFESLITDLASFRLETNDLTSAILTGNEFRQQISQSLRNVINQIESGETYQKALSHVLATSDPLVKAMWLGLFKANQFWQISTFFRAIGEMQKGRSNIRAAEQRGEDPDKEKIIDNSLEKAKSRLAKLKNLRAIMESDQDADMKVFEIMKDFDQIAQSILQFQILQLGTVK